MAMMQADNPYVGPRTFGADERAKFFGRDQEARELTATIISHRLSLFYAPSGAGKSSLLNTTIRPKLEDEGFEVLPIGRVSGFQMADVPCKNIFAYNLLLSLQQQDVSTTKFNNITLAAFLDNLVRQADGSYHFRPDHVYPDNFAFKPRVLVIDQFEELITTNNSAWEQRDEFFIQLEEAITIDPQLWIVLTMREDFVARLDPFLHLTSSRLRHRYYMERLSHAAALDAIRYPAQLAGRPFAEGAAELLRDNLCRIRDFDAIGRYEPRFEQYVEPVQLQAVCYQMWERLRARPADQITIADVERFADIDTALINFFEETIRTTVAKTDVTELELRAWFERELITESGTRNTVFRGEETTGGLPTSVADVVRQQFILREVVRPGGTWYELVHDRFVAPIVASNQGWKQEQPLIQLAQAWDERGRPPELLLPSGQLEQIEKSDWQALGALVIDYVTAGQVARDELEAQVVARELAQQRALAEAEGRRAKEAKRAASRQRILAIVGVLLALMAGVFALVSFNAQNRAVAAQATAEAERQAAIEAGQAAISAQQTAEAERIQADMARETATTLERSTRAQSLTLLASNLANNTQVNNELAILLSIEAHRLDEETGGSANWLINQSLRELLTQPFLSTLALDVSPATGNGVAFSADNTFLATATDDGIYLRELAQGGRRTQLGEGEMSSVAFSADYIAATSDKMVQLWKLADEGSAPITLPVEDGRLFSVTFSPDQRWLGAIGEQAVWLWRTDDWRNVCRLDAHESDVWSLAISADNRLATASADGTVRLWNLPTANCPTARNWIGQINGFGTVVRSVTFSPKGDQLATGSDNGTIVIWDVSNPSAARRQAACGILADLNSGAQKQIFDLTFSNDGSRLAIAGEGNLFWVWEVARDCADRAILRGHKAWVRAVAFSADDRWIASASDDGTARIWDLNTNAATPISLLNHSDWVRSVVFSADQSTLLSGSEDGGINRWNLADLSLQTQTFLPENAAVLSLAASDNGEWIAAGGEDFAIHLWQRNAPNRTAQTLTGHTGKVIALDFSPDNRLLASGSEDGTVRMWSLADLSQLPVWIGRSEQPISAVTFSSDGQLFVTAGYDGTIQVWQVGSWREPKFTLEGHTDRIRTLAFAPDGSLLASGGYDDLVRVWDVAQPTAEPVVLRGHESDIFSVTFSHDGRWLATGGFNDTIRIWDVRDFSAEPIPLRGHDSWIESLAFSPDDQWLASGSSDATVRLWQPHTEQLVAVGCQTVERNLTLEEWQSYLPADDTYRCTCGDLPVHESVLSADVPHLCEN